MQLVKGPAYVHRIQNEKEPPSEEDIEEVEEVNLGAIEDLVENQKSIKLDDSKKPEDQDSGYSEAAAAYDQKLKEENNRLKEERLCKICVEREVGVVFIPCGHLATCLNCAPSFDKCPVCRTKITSAVRTFI